MIPITSSTINTITKKQSNLNSHQETKDEHASATETKKNFQRPNSKISSPNHGNIKRLRKADERIYRYRVDFFGNEINPSKDLITKYQYKLLSKNLNFCPTPER